MACFIRRAWIGVFVLALAPAGVADADQPVPAIPAQYALRDLQVPNYPPRSYLDELAPPPRLQDKRRIKLRYDRPIEMGQTKMLLRLKASPKPSKLVRFELRF